MSVILELGPGESFVFDSPAGTTTNHLPEGLRDLEAGIGQGRPIQAVYSVNFGWNGAYLLAARTVNGPIIRRHNLPPQLESWLIDPITHTCKRDIATLAAELGPNGSFYARDKDSYRWHNLPDALEEAIQQRLCPAGWTARPDFVVLGADGAYIYSNDSGGHSYALGNYPKLMELILGLQRANVGGLTGFGLIQWVSMSIYQPGHFIALHNSGHHVANLSPATFQALNSMAGTFPVRNLTPQQPQRAVSSPLMQQPSPPIRQQVSPPIMHPASPPMMTHNALPVRKAVATSPPAMHHPSPPTMHPQASARPQPSHLVSSPIPQAHPHRPTPHTVTSLPIPQAHPTPRPVSMQIPPAQPKAGQHRQSMNTNLKAMGQLASFFKKESGGYSSNNANNNNNTAYNNNTNNTAGTTYVVPGDSGSGTMPGDSGVYSVPGDSGTSSTAADSGVYTAADSGSIATAGDSGTASTAGDSGSGGVFSGWFSGGDSGGGGLFGGDSGGGDSSSF